VIFLLLILRIFVVKLIYFLVILISTEKQKAINMSQPQLKFKHDISVSINIELIKNQIDEYNKKLNSPVSQEALTVLFFIYNY
jgi:hypothetical protein